MNIALCGFYGKSNFGDNLMQDLLSDTLSDNGKNNVRIYSDVSDNRVINGFEASKHLDNDLIVIGGGGIVSPGFWAFKEGRLQKLIKAQKPVYFLNVNVTEELENRQSFMNQIQLLNAKWWVRDRASINTLKNFDINANYLPDVSTYQKIMPQNKIKNSKELVVFVNSYVFNDLGSHETTKFLRCQDRARVLASFLDWMTHFGWHITFYPCQTSLEQDDRISAAFIFQLMKEKKSATWITAKPNWRETVEVIQSSELILSMRYHPSVVALTNSVATVDITHHSKNRNFLLEHNLANISIDYTSLFKDKLIKTTQIAEAKEYSSDVLNISKESSELWDNFRKELVCFL